jgi:hypothetical protein
MKSPLTQPEYLFLKGVIKMAEEEYADEFRESIKVTSFPISYMKNVPFEVLDSLERQQLCSQTELKNLKLMAVSS